MGSGRAAHPAPPPAGGHPWSSHRPPPAPLWPLSRPRHTGRAAPRQGVRSLTSRGAASSGWATSGASSVAMLSDTGASLFSGEKRRACGTAGERLPSEDTSAPGAPAWLPPLPGAALRGKPEWRPQWLAPACCPPGGRSPCPLQPPLPSPPRGLLTSPPTTSGVPTAAAERTRTGERPGSWAQCGGSPAGGWRAGGRRAWAGRTRGWCWRGSWRPGPSGAGRECQGPAWKTGSRRRGRGAKAGAAFSAEERPAARPVWPVPAGASRALAQSPVPPGQGPQPLPHRCPSAGPARCGARGQLHGGAGGWPPRLADVPQDSRLRAPEPPGTEASPGTCSPASPSSPHPSPRPPFPQPLPPHACAPQEPPRCPSGSCHSG